MSGKIDARLRPDTPLNEAEHHFHFIANSELVFHLKILCLYFG
jgi:hypothetical protein